MRLEVDAAGRPAAPPQPLAASRFHESNAATSPDGRWMACESDEVDSLVRAYVRSFPGGGHLRWRVTISITGGRFDADPARGRFPFLKTSAESVEPPLTRPVLLGGSADPLRPRPRLKGYARERPRIRRGRPAQTMRPAPAGVVIGTAVAVAVTRLFTAMLFGVEVRGCDTATRILGGPLHSRGAGS